MSKRKKKKKPKIKTQKPWDGQGWKTSGRGKVSFARTEESRSKSEVMQAEMFSALARSDTALGQVMRAGEFEYKCR